MHNPPNQSDSESILQRLEELETRIAQIERQLSLLSGSVADNPLPAVTPSTEETKGETSDSLEFRIGQNWFARLGIVALAIGIIFLLTFPYQGFPRELPSVVGYLIVATIIMLSRYWRKMFPMVSGYLFGSGLLLAYFTTLRLHYFATEAAIANMDLELLLLMTVVAVNLVVSIRKSSPYLTGLNVLLGFVTAIIGADHQYLFYASVLVFSGLVVYLKLKYDWEMLYGYGIVLAYVAQFIVAMNNPFAGNEMHLQQPTFTNLTALLLTSLIFASGNLIRHRSMTEDFHVLFTSLINAIGCYGLFLLITMMSENRFAAVSQLVASILFLALATTFWIRVRSKYSTFIYALIGYTAMGVAIVLQVGVPDCFIWLSWQSVLVIATAVWYRSRFIVVANFFIFLISFVVYLLLAGKVSFISIGFGIVALLSARILNWQKHRLELKTEMMRNAYLAAAFIIIPYALYYAVPSGYVSFAWIGVAVLYYIIGIVLKNQKYRWMSLLTFSLAGLYTIIIGVVQLEAFYRIASFLVLGIVLLVVSLLYARSKGRARSPMAETSLDMNESSTSDDH